MGTSIPLTLKPRQKSEFELSWCNVGLEAEGSNTHEGVFPKLAIQDQARTLRALGWGMFSSLRRRMYTTTVP